MAAVKFAANDASAEEDYIDIDFTSSSAAAGFHLSCPPEFEFQMSAAAEEAAPIASPADELFYNGKILPLRLPRSSLMTADEESVQRRPASSVGEMKNAAAVDAGNSAAATPYMSCNASPVASCFVSGELSSEDFFHECSEELEAQSGGHRLHPEKSWGARKLKSIKEATLSLKQKASRARIRSFFAKSWGRSEKCAAAALKAKQTSHGGLIMEGKKKTAQEEKSSHRRSFSSASTNWQYSSTKSLISSSSSSSSSSALRRSSSVNSDLESSIQGAIAYCKKSQQMKETVRKSASDVGFCLLSGTKIAPDGEFEKARLIEATKNNV